MFFVIAKYYIFLSEKNYSMDMLKKLDSDIELGSMKQFSASLLVEDNTLDALNWTSEFAGRWEDNRTADEVVEDIRGARTSNKEIIISS